MKESVRERREEMSEKQQAVDLSTRGTDDLLSVQSAKLGGNE